jgi:hypothetical protein
VAGIELKSGEAHSSYTCSTRKGRLVSRDQSLGNWLMIQNIDSQNAEIADFVAIKQFFIIL